MDAEQPTPRLGSVSPTQMAAMLNPGAHSGVMEENSAGSDDPSVLQLHLPQYRVCELIGRGGMGNVMKVDDPKLARTVALKTMKLGPDATAEERGRFVREATVLARLAHPNIVPIYDLGADGAGSPFYTMKLVRGCTLAAILKNLRGGAPEAVEQHSLDRRLGIFRKVCDALAFAHSKDVLHRDLKPENIMVGEFGEVLVMDWGLAKILHADEDAWSMRQSIVQRSRAAIGPSTMGATLTGSLLGTPQYMAPEQARGEVETLDARADIYALGAILFHILALRPPVEGKDENEVLTKVVGGQIEPLKGAMASSRSSIPESLAAVVRKAMALDKSARYQCVGDLQREIEAFQSGFATAAENAGFVKQVALLIKRNKGIFATGFIAWLVITALVVWLVVNVTHERNVAESERNRAGREAMRANHALADLKKSAPSLVALAESEAGFQRFDSALEKHYGLDSAPRAELFMPAWQQPLNGMALIVRTASDPNGFIETIRREVLAIDAEQPIYDVSSMVDVVSRSVFLPRISMLLLAAFAVSALLLAIVGIYGVVSYTVTERTRELGVRMALGADAETTLRLVLGRSMLLVAGGTMCGLIASFAITRAIAGLLFDVSPLDPMVFVGVSVLLAASGFVASVIPARRATRVDPIVALRVP